MGKITRHELSPILQQELDSIGSDLSVNADKLTQLENTVSTATDDITAIQDEIISAESIFPSLNDRFVDDETKISNLQSSKMNISTYDVDGNGIVDKAAKLATARTISLIGDATGGIPFDGDGDVSIDVTINDNSHNHTISNITNLQSILDSKAPLNSPELTGNPTAPTAILGTNTTQLATTSFVNNAVDNLIDLAPSSLDTLNKLSIALGNDPNFATSVSNTIATKAPLISPTLTGIPIAPTAIAGTNTTQLATTAFVTTAASDVVAGNVASATKLATARTISLTGDVTGSVSFDGTTNASISTVIGDDTHNHTISNIDNLQSSLDAKAPLISPSLTGTPTAPTATAGTNTTQIASTAFVTTEVANVVAGNVASATKLATARTISLTGDVTGSVSFDGTANASITATIIDDSHNHIISNIDNLQSSLDAKAPLVSPTFTGTPISPTATAGTNTTQIATTAFVNNAVSNLVNSAPATLDTLNELATALGNDPNFATTISNQIGTKAPLISPSLTGTPTAPTATAGTNTTQLATTSFVTTAVSNKTTITGNAGTATKLQTARTISLTGDVTGSVSFDGTANASITATIIDDSHNHIISNIDGLQAALNAKAPFSTLSATTAATLGWYRITTSVLNIGSNSGLFKIDFSGTGVKGSALFRASCHDGANLGSSINQLGFTTTNIALGLTQVRVVYNTTATGNYAYVEVYNPTALAITYTVDLIDATGWTLVSPSTAGSIPSGYTSETLILDLGVVSLEDITAYKQLRSNIATGTSPLAITSTTMVPNLNSQYLNGQLGTYYAPLASPTFTGTPAVPTATAGTNTTQAASTAFVTTAVANKTTITGNAGTATKLQTARTINGVSFDGTSNKIVPTIYDSSYKSIINPDGAIYNTTIGTITGAMAITLPVGMVGTMIRMTIKIYEYASNKSFDVHCGGYNYSSGNTWANNPFAYIVGNPSMDRRLNVRFGYTSGAKAIIYIGETSSTWSYPQIVVTDVQCGFAGQSVSYTSGWSIGFATAFENVTATISNAQVGYAVSTNTGNSTVFRDSSGNFSAGTITAALSGNSTSATKLQTARTISLTGDVTGSVSFNGTANAIINTTLKAGITWNDLEGA